MNKEELKEARLAFTDDTVKYHSEDVTRRGLSNDKAFCAYRGYNGTKCAIGRHIPDDQYNVNFENESLTDRIMQTLPEEVQLLGKDFLNEVQNLHDGPIYWDENGLTKLGIREVEYIKSYI